MSDENGNFLLGENRAVSPVIGVILMVAITVILAAVIGGFVLGLGGNLQQTPQAQLSADVAPSSAGNTGDGVLRINHGGGDSLESGSYEVRIKRNSGSFVTVIEDSTTNAGSTDGTDIQVVGGYPGEFGVGDRITIEETAGTRTGTYTVQIIHTPSEGIVLEEEVEVE